MFDSKALASGNNGLHFVYNEQDKCYYEINQNLNSTDSLFPYEKIPEGKSPKEYGYIPRTPEELAGSTIVDR